MPWFNQKPPAAQTLDGVLQEISAPFSRLPKDAVRWARKHPEEITPHLIQIIKRVPAYARFRSSDSDVPESHAHIVALYLLLEFGNREILPTLLNLLSDPDQDVVDCYGDVIDGDLAQILVEACDAGEMEEVWIGTEEIEDALSNGNNTFSETLHNQ